MLPGAMSRREQNALPRLALRGKRRRPFEDRLAIRFPSLAARIYAWVTRVTLGMPRRWRLRRWLIELSVWRAFNALGRGDLAVLRTINHADVIYDLSGWGWPEASLYRGRDGVIRFNELWLAQWSEPDFDVASIEELDLGLFLIDGRSLALGLPRLPPAARALHPANRPVARPSSARGRAAPRRARRPSP
jgi:hypothetical protein